MKNVMVLLHDDAGLPSRLQVALDLVRALDGKLICLDLTVPIFAMSDDPMFGPLLLEDRESVAVDTGARATIEASGVPFQWIERRGDFGREIADVAETADLAVLSTPKDTGLWEMRQAIGRLLVKSGKPVVAVPLGSAGLRLDGRVAVLWDGSEQVHNALAAAMPLLRHAAQVTIIEVDDGSLRMPAQHVAAFLDHHDVPHETRSVPAAGEKAAFPLLEEIRRVDPAYVVMGGFGHSRLIEQLFGGVTEHLLSECAVPLFLKH